MSAVPATHTHACCGAVANHWSTCGVVRGSEHRDHIARYLPERYREDEDDGDAAVARLVDMIMASYTANTDMTADTVRAYCVWCWRVGCVWCVKCLSPHCCHRGADIHVSRHAIALHPSPPSHTHTHTHRPLTLTSPSYAIGPSMEAPSLLWMAPRRTCPLSACWL